MWCTKQGCVHGLCGVQSRDAFMGCGVQSRNAFMGCVVYKAGMRSWAVWCAKQECVHGLFPEWDVNESNDARRYTRLNT
ncbi:hypothetical protein DPMN_044701 [Dreissena polymorpha]|uniref:Uncharacterized protein n=1 Tax=Dreissena polymorpha TaxID=45954 RepID=A0A9D4D2W9_DREPO|nr:hypothetical protein DPMN_044701 [Dreissena polymorpha]